MTETEISSHGEKTALKKIFFAEKMALKNEKTALKRWNWIQEDIKDTFEELQSCLLNAPSACKEMLQKDLKNCMTNKMNWAKSWVLANDSHFFQHHILA